MRAPLFRPLCLLAIVLSSFVAESALSQELYEARVYTNEKGESLNYRLMRPGGLLVYETFSRAQMARADNPLRSADFTLAPRELPTLFPELTVVEYEEIDLADRSVARLVARR